MSGGFIAIYRWRVQPEHEARFRAVWRTVTERLAGLGGKGSCLTRSDEGVLTAIALWPDTDTRERAFAAGDADPGWPPFERLGEERLTVIEDMWSRSPFGAGRA